MTRIKLKVAAAIVALVSTSADVSAQLYDPPAGGWTYTYTGDLGMPGADFTALDGTWSHDNGSDSWDESIIGMGSPGGVTGGLIDETDGTVYVRLQETGDPRDHGMPDPSNRKLYFGHNITDEGATDTILDDGVTLSFRGRVATGGILDPLHPDGGGAISPWPDGGVGYNLHNGSKSIFTIKQAAGGSVSFALALPSSEGTPSPGLVTNSLNGNAVSGDVDGFDEGGEHNFLAFSDATEWHEYWVTIQAGGSGTHQVQLWRDGTAVASTFDVTAGNGNDFGGSYLALGLGATPRQGAIDVDFFSWAPGVISPANAATPEPGDFNLDGVVNVDDYLIQNANLNLNLERDVFFEDGDIDGDGDVDLDDFGQFKAIAPGAVAAAQGVPEPSSLALLAVVLVACSAVAARRRGGRRTAGFALILAACGMLTQAATAQDVAWIGQTGSYTDGSNWDAGFPPDVMFGESGLINNGGMAQLSEDSFIGPDDLTLGENAGDSGTLEIQNGGNLTIADVFLVGDDGEGHLIMRPGSSLTVMDDMGNVGAAASSVLLGGTGAADPVTINVSDNMEFHRNLRVVGPNVQATAADVVFGDEGTYTAEITGPAHSALVGTGSVALGGALHLEFNGVDPTAADSWVLADGASISGSFSNITSNVELDPGFGFFVTTSAGGTQGQIATLEIDTRLQLSVDPNSGAALIENLTETESIDIDGYTITSTAGHLAPANWSSIADGDATWVESDTSSVRLGETNFTGSMVIGPRSSIPLGSIVTSPTDQGMLDDLSFLYHIAGGGTLSGLKALSDVMPPEFPPGDYNANGTVEQADLDLVLLNWGAAFDTLPAEWVNERPTEGIVAQAQLDGVLLNWGATAGAALGAAAGVPEPSTVTLLLATAGLGLGLARRR